jgi:hypothetical protein
MSNFWSNANVTPKRNFRFIVQLGDDILWYGKTAKLPSVTFGETEHHFLDNKYYFPGKPTWEEVSLTLVDPGTPDATAKLWTMLQKQGYEVKGDKNNHRTISKTKAVDPTNGIGSVQIQVLKDDGTPVETWELKRAFIKSISFSDLDYANEDLREITLGLRYDWAECKIGNTDYFKPISG